MPGVLYWLCISFVVPVPDLKLFKTTFGCYYIKIMDGDEHSGCFMKHNIMGVEFCSGLSIVKEYLPLVLHLVF